MNALSIKLILPLEPSCAVPSSRSSLLSELQRSYVIQGELLRFYVLIENFDSSGVDVKRFLDSLVLDCKFVSRNGDDNANDNNDNDDELNVDSVTDSVSLTKWMASLNVIDREPEPRHNYSVEDIVAEQCGTDSVWQRRFCTLEGSSNVLIPVQLPVNIVEEYIATRSLTLLVTLHCATSFERGFRCDSNSALASDLYSILNQVSDDDPVPVRVVSRSLEVIQPIQVSLEKTAVAGATLFHAHVRNVSTIAVQLRDFQVYFAALAGLQGPGRLPMPLKGTGKVFLMPAVEIESHFRVTIERASEAECATLLMPGDVYSYVITMEPLYLLRAQEEHERRLSGGSAPPTPASSGAGNLSTATATAGMLTTATTSEAISSSQSSTNAAAASLGAVGERLPDDFVSQILITWSMKCLHRHMLSYYELKLTAPKCDDFVVTFRVPTPAAPLSEVFLIEFSVTNMTARDADVTIKLPPFLLKSFSSRELKDVSPSTAIRRRRLLFDDEMQLESSLLCFEKSLYVGPLGAHRTACAVGQFLALTPGLYTGTGAVILDSVSDTRYTCAKAVEVSISEQLV